MQGATTATAHIGQLSDMGTSLKQAVGEFASALQTAVEAAAASEAQAVSATTAAASATAAAAAAKAAAAKAAAAATEDPKKQQSEEVGAWTGLRLHPSVSSPRELIGQRRCDRCLSLPPSCVVQR